MQDNWVSEVVLLLDNMISIKYLGPDKIKIYEKSYKNILIYCIGYVKLNRIKPLYLMINTINGYIDEHNANKHLTLD